MAEERQVLHEAYELIKAGNKQEATRLLVQYLKAHRNNADAWWLLANATNDASKKRQALEQVLRIQPDHGAAQRALAKLGVGPAAQAPAPPPPAPAPPPRTPPVAEDPFADPFGSPEASDDPFAEFAPPGPGSPPPAAQTPPRARPVDDDPFADPFSQPAPAPARRQPAAADDPFGDPFVTDEPFAEPVRPRQTVEPRRQKKSGTNPVLIILAIVGIVAVVGCGLVVLLVSQGVAFFGTAVGTAVADPTFQAVLNDPTLQAAFSDPTVQAALENGGNYRTIEKGAIIAGEPIRAEMEADGYALHAYKFTGSEGQRVVIELTAVDDEFDPRVQLIGPDGEIVDENDDIDLEEGNYNSRIETTLPASGAYTIIVGDVGFGGGDYMLTLN